MQKKINEVCSGAAGNITLLKSHEVKIKNNHEMKIQSLIALAMSVCAQARTPVELPLPEVPANLTQPSERAAYVLLHFWDAMDWKNKALTGDDQFMEQNSSNFYSLFNMTDSVSESTAVGRMLEGASADMEAYRKVADIAKTYLYEPYSPVADDDAYAVVADRLLADGKLDEAELLRIEETHRMAMKNRVGEQAADFEYTDRTGRRCRLSDETGSKDYLLLMFYDPDCQDCAELEHHLQTASEFKRPDFGVLMVSPYGGGELWERHASTIPAEWAVGYTDDADLDELYDIRVTPTVYLLDRNGKVLAKNVTIDGVKLKIETERQKDRK